MNCDLILIWSGCILFFLLHSHKVQGLEGQLSNSHPKAVTQGFCFTSENTFFGKNTTLAGPAGI